MENTTGSRSNLLTSNEIIENLVYWCSQEFEIKTCPYNFIKNFLIACNYNEEKCQKMLIKYFLYKRIHAEYFQAGSLGDEKFRYFCTSVFSLYIPVLTKDGYRIFIDKVTHNEDLFDVGMIMKYFSMQTDLRYLEDGPDNGDLILFDCNHINFLSFITFLPYFIKSLSLILEMYPLNLRQLIIINTGETIATTLNFFRRFAPRKYQEMVYFYADGSDKFLLHVEADVLPSDYAGKLPTFEEMRTNLMVRLDSNREWFENTNTQINETSFFSKEQKIALESMSSFKQLHID